MFHDLGVRAGAVLLGLAFAASACGGGGADAANEPRSAPSSTSTTPTQAPTSTSSPTVEPLSRFEDRPPVKAARAWASALGRAVNMRRFDQRTLGRVATPAGMASSKFGTSYDTSHRYRWPGPLPFTPVKVHTRGATAYVTACLFVQGWAIDPSTGKLGQPNKVGPVTLELRRTAGRWLFNGASNGGTTRCDEVTVKGVKW